MLNQSKCMLHYNNNENARKCLFQPQRLEEGQCADKNLVEMLFEEA